LKGTIKDISLRVKGNFKKIDVSPANLIYCYDFIFSMKQCHLSYPQFLTYLHYCHVQEVRIAKLKKLNQSFE
jgi:hypothetical protein